VFELFSKINSSAAVEGTTPIEAWKKANLPVQKGQSKVWGMERQVRFAAGLLVLLGLVLSWILHPAFIALSFFISAGLIYSAVSDSCGMAMVLAKFPWNRAI